MSSFFTKSKLNFKTSSSKVSVSAIAGPSTSCSDFDKTFKPFTLKKGAQLAPINAFLERKPTAGTRDDVIIVDEDESPPVASTNADAVNTSAQGTDFFTNLKLTVAHSSFNQNVYLIFFQRYRHPFQRRGSVHPNQQHME